MSRTVNSLILFAAVAALGACATDVTDVIETTELLSVIPAGGATGVDPNEPITIQFSHPVGVGMEQYVVLHEGGVNGEIVPGTWTWSEDRMALTFVPDQPLQAQTEYAIHIGGGLMDSNGNVVDCRRGEGFGGQWVGGGMMGGMGSVSSTMMGQGWQHPNNGTYGMIFTFTTA
jgi:hypothetical protein